MSQSKIKVHSMKLRSHGAVEDDDQGQMLDPNSNDDSGESSPRRPGSVSTVVSRHEESFKSTGSTTKGSLGQGGQSSSKKSESHASSKKLQLSMERLKLQEEATKLKLELTTNRLHQLDLLEEDEDAESASLSSDGGANSTTKFSTITWVKEHHGADCAYRSKPAEDKTSPIFHSQVGEQRNVEDGHRPPFQFQRFQSTPEAHQSSFYAQPPPPQADSISQLAQALSAAISQPQQQLERYMARQTLGKDLPVFSGDVEEWQAFVSSFRTSTSECRIPDSQNLVRLQKALKGKARECVRALLVSEKNVPEIVRVLEKQFGQPQTIIRSLMEKVRATPAVPNDSTDTIVQYGIVVRNLVKTVESLGKLSYLHNPQFIEELADKLPCNLRMQWAAVVVNMRPTEANLSDFSKWLEKMTDIALILNRSVSSMFEESAAKTSKKDGRNSDKKKKEVSMATHEAEAAVEVGKKNSKLKCTFCSKSNHGVWECYSFRKLEPKERSEWCAKNNCCYCCLRPGHRSTKCWKKKSCGIDQCTRMHHELLHYNDDKNAAEKDDKKSKVPLPEHEQPSSSNWEINGHVGVGERSVLLRILPVEVRGPRGVMRIHAICDEASSVSLLDESIAEKLSLPGPTAPLTLTWTDASAQVDNTSRKVDLGIRGVGVQKWFGMKSVRTVNKLKLPTQSINYEKFKEKWNHLDEVKVEDYRNATPLLLIGQDHIHLIIAREVKEGPVNAPVASRTKLGWTIHGNSGSRLGRVDKQFSFCAYTPSKDEELHQLVKNSFSLDAVGVTVNSKKLKSKQENRAEMLMESKSRRIGDRYEAPLLWKIDEPSLPLNKKDAFRRLLSIEKKMDRNEEFAGQYCKKIERYLELGYARKLTEEEASIVTPKTWYLPHFFAYHPNKPDKPRLVFDCAAVSSGQSLNSNLVSGPDELKSLPGIIMKFREQRVAFTADIREMFHMVRILEEDQQAQRFLWRGRDRQQPPSSYSMSVMTFGATCSPYSAQFIKNKNAMEFQKQFPEAVDSILNSHYVDDLADSVDEEEKAIALVKEITFVHSKGGFDITKWSSNSAAVMESIPEEHRAEGMTKLDMCQEIPSERVLGLLWNPADDTFQFATDFKKVDAAIISGEKIPTKRDVLKTVMSIFDPLGFLSHYVIKAKIIYQEVWRSGIDWDDPIHEKQLTAWKKWIQLLPSISDLKIPRHYFSGEKVQDCQLHLFCDASEESYAAVGYIRYVVGTAVFVMMVMAKTRVAPLKLVSIPRLELQSAMLAVRIAEFIQKEQKLSFSSVTYWTDAKTVIQWLRSDTRKYKPYVAHRVGEILEKSEVTDWRWLSTKLNVADEATRLIPFIKPEYDSRWYLGPEFLYSPEENWPRENFQGSISQEELEIKKEYCNLHAVKKVKVNFLPEAERFSSWIRLIRATAWIRKFVMWKFKLGETRIKELEVQDLRWAQKQWWKCAQSESFPVEYSLLKEKQTIPKDSKLANLSPFLDEDGVMRVNSRTVYSPELSKEQKFPVILDPSHPFTKLLVMQYHIWALHQGQEMVVNELRQKFWILRVRQAVKSAWSSCLRCKMRKATPVPPEMAPLPAFRVTKPVRPFWICGLDYFGPLTVTKFRRHEKRWGALFTCMHTRAVHLELVDSLSTDSVIMALTRMASVRGWPAKFYSDNGTNFRGAALELNRSLKELDHKKILSELAIKEVEWHFIPPLSPHFGGTWERMVRSVKKALEVVLKERAPKEEVMRTLFAEAVNVVNSRPLTYVPGDSDDGEVLTPNCFLIGTTSAAPLLGEFTERDLVLRKQWRLTQRLADQFWRRWVKEYLPTLMRRSKWLTSSKPLEVGDVVILVDDNQPRNVWPKGLVEKVFPGKDGVVRVADVRTRNGTFRRPVAKICVLDGVREKDCVPDAVGTPRGSMLANAEREMEILH